MSPSVNQSRRGWGQPWLVIVAAITVLVGASGCQGEANTEEPTLQKIQRLRVVKVGYANEAPYAYLDPQTGELTGEAPEIARIIFKQMGVDRIEGVLTEFGALIPGLKSGRFDMIAAGMYITPERCREIAFSNPTYKIGEAFLVKAGNPLQLNSYEAVADHAQARLGVVAGAVELGYARAVGIPTQRIVILPDAPSAVEAVQAGRVDAYAGTALTIQDMLTKANDRQLERAQPFTNPTIAGQPVIGYGAFGIRQQDQALLSAVNGQLQTFIGSPEHRQLVAPFGFTPAELPGKQSAATLCQPPSS